MTSSPTVEALRAAAMDYAGRGWRVGPCRAGGKEPATEHGVKDFTTDPVQIAQWWASVPYNIGIATGPESGIFVVDVDPRNGGEWRPSIETYAVSTGGDGFHHYFNWPEGAAKLRPKLQPGVDIKGAGGYVVAPPSVTTGSYEVFGEGGIPHPVVSAPADLLSVIAIAAGAVNIDARPGDRFNDEHTWAEILEPYGWQVARIDASLTYWTRPDKDEGISATTGVRDSQGEPADLLYVFTTSTPFEANVGVDKFGAYAILEHDGDVSAAAAALASPAPRLHGAVGAAHRPTDAVNGSTGSRPVAMDQPTAPPMGSPGSPPAPASPAHTFEPALPPEHFVSQYIEYGAMLTDAAAEYHEAAALALLASVTSSIRIELAPFPEGLRTNLYLAIVGESSRSRKSTVQQIALGFLHRLLPDSVLPDRMTGESAIGQLALRSGKTAIWMNDEIGIAIAEIYGVSFMSAMDGLLLSMYSGQPYRYTTVAGQQSIEDVHLNIFGASTPESFGSIGSRAISSGLLPRFGIVYPASPPPSRPPTALSSGQTSMRGQLEHKLRQTLLAVSVPGGKRNVTFSPEALAALGSMDAVYGKNRLTARLSVAAYKVAALLALSDEAWCVDTAHAQAANKVVSRWAAGALRLRAHLGRPASDYAFAELMDVAREELGRAVGLGVVAGRKVIPRIEAARLLKLEHRTLNRVRDSLNDTGEIIVVSDGGVEEWHYA